MSSGVRFDSVADLPAWAQKQLVKKMTAEPQKSYLQDLQGTDPSTPLRSAQDDREKCSVFILQPVTCAWGQARGSYRDIGAAGRAAFFMPENVQ